MTGNITEEQFKKFCKDFVEKYEGRNFQELIRRLGGGWKTVYKNNIMNEFNFYNVGVGLSFGTHFDGLIFGHIKNFCYIFINSFGSSNNNFYTIEDLYKFFKMDYKETKEPTNIPIVTFNISIETIKEDYIEILSKKHNLNKESIELKIIMWKSKREP